jgi:Inhibitor of Apoptosis domain.
MDTNGIIHHSGPTNSKFSTLEARLRTFREWPPALRQKPKDMAEAGFFYIGKEHSWGQFLGERLTNDIFNPLQA